MFALIVACGGGGNGDDAEPPGQSGTSSGLDAVAVATVTPTVPATPTPTLEEVLRGFAYPIEGGCLPEGNQLMPNAPREYRQGTHEGVDFYDVDICTPVTIGTPVLAAKQGTVVRVDHDYQDPTFEQMSAYLADPLNEASLDALRGRQVWVDHGGGVVTRYCHLSGITEGLKEGDVVEQGALLGMVGESGTPESLSNPGSEYHLHWEVRIGDSFLGAGEEPDQVRALYQALFEP